MSIILVHFKSTFPGDLECHKPVEPRKGQISQFKQPQIFRSDFRKFGQHHTNITSSWGV